MRQIDMKKWQCVTDIKKMRGGVFFSKTFVRERRSERRNENIIVSGIIIIHFYHKNIEH